MTEAGSNPLTFSPNTLETQQAANLANAKYGDAGILSSDRIGTLILNDQEALVLQSKDHLTGLENRASWTEHALELLKLYDRLKEPDVFFALIIMDLDHFKYINDLHGGHPSGDSALKQIAETVKRLFRNVDAIGRYGGDELSQAGLSGHTQPEKIASQFELIRKQISDKTLKLPNGDSIKVSQSWGLVIMDTTGMDQLMVDSGLTREDNNFFPELLNRIIMQADKAVYQAKANGRNRLETKIITKSNPLNIPTPPLPHHP